MNVSRKPFRLIWPLIPLVWILPIVYPDEIIDIQLHDTYFVFYLSFFAWLVTCFIGGVGIIYEWWASGNYLNLSLIVLHTVSIWISAILFAVLVFLSSSFHHNGLGETPPCAQHAEKLTTVFITELLLITLAIALFLMNVLVGLANWTRANR